MKIRYGKLDDIETISKYVKEILTKHAKKEPLFLNEDFLRDVNPEEYYKVIDGDNSILLVAEDEGKLAGFLKLDIKEIEPFFVSEKVLYADEIYVLEEYRKQGVANMLMEKAADVARNRKIMLMKARVYTFNKPAKEVLRSDGFTELYSEFYKVIE